LAMGRQQRGTKARIDGGLSMFINCGCGIEECWERVMMAWKVYGLELLDPPPPAS
jgi:hypothetical protein